MTEPAKSELFEEMTDERLEAYRQRVLDAHLGTVLGMYIKHEGGVPCASCGFTTHEGYQYTGIGEVCFYCGVRLTLRGMIKRIDSAESKLSFVEECFEQLGVTSIAELVYQYDKRIERLQNKPDED